MILVHSIYKAVLEKTDHRAVRSEILLNIRWQEAIIDAIIEMNPSCDYKQNNMNMNICIALPKDLFIC